MCRCPPQGTARPCRPPRGQLLSTGSAQTQQSPEGQPSLWPSRARGRQGGAPAAATNSRSCLAGPSCPAQSGGTRAQPEDDAQGSCGIIPKARMVGHPQGLQSQLSLPSPAPGAQRGLVLAPTGAQGAQKMTRSSCVLSHHRLLFRVPKLLSSSSCSLASSTNTCSSVA